MRKTKMGNKKNARMSASVYLWRHGLSEYQSQELLSMRRVEGNFLEAEENILCSRRFGGTA